jgi:hypothetical protein
MTDLRPEALLKLVNDGEATWEWVAKSSATLRALAAQQTETPPESERQRFEAWAAVQALALRRIHDDDDAGMDYVNTHTDASWEAWKARAALAAPSQPMAGEPLAALLRDCREREYNPFEPDNQSRLYHRIVAALAQPMAGEPWALLREALTEALPLVEMFQRSESLTVVQRLHIVEVAERIRAALAQHGDKTCTKP